MKNYPYPSHVILWLDVEVVEDVTYEVKLMQVLVGKEQDLRNKVILLVKVFWQYHYL